MKTNLLTRGLLLLVLCLLGLAQAPASLVITFSQPDGLIVHKSQLTPSTLVSIAIHVTARA